MDERFVVAVFVEGRELEVAVEKETDLAVLLGEHDALIGGRARQDDRVLIQLSLGPLHQVVRERHTHQEQDERAIGLGREPRPAMFTAEEVAGPDRNQHVEDTKHKRRPHQPDPWYEPEWKQQRGGQGAQIVEGQHFRDQVAQGELILEDADQERDLQTDQHASRGHPAVEHDTEGGDLGEREEQHGRGDAADDAHQDLDLDEARNQVTPEVARQVGADPHREQVDPDDRRELCHAVAQEVAGNGAGQQLVDQPAGGDGEDRHEERASLDAGAVRRGCSRVVHGATILLIERMGVNRSRPGGGGPGVRHATFDSRRVVR